MVIFQNHHNTGWNNHYKHQSQTFDAFYLIETGKNFTFAAILAFGDEPLIVAFCISVLLFKFAETGTNIIA
jgi:hypothetical protein